MQSRFFFYALLILSIVLNTIGIVRWNAGAPYDTANKGLETIEEVLQGNLEPFYRHYNGQPPFMDWLLAGAFLLFGISPYTLHIVGILSGILATVLWYTVGKTLWSTRAGLYASAFGTTSHWFLLETREGTHNIPLVPLLLLVIWCIAVIYKTTDNRIRYLAALVGGCTAGLMGYVYAAGWIFCFLFAAAFPVMILIASIRRQWVTRSLPLLIVTIMMVSIWLPFIQYTREDPRSVFIHADDEVRTREPSELIKRVASHIPPMVGAFTFLVVPPFNTWENNTTLSVAGIPIPFPVPFVSPVGGALLLISIGCIIWGWYHKQSMLIPTVLVLLLVIAVIPNLLTVGPQPHYRRTVCAMVPLFLLIGWAAAQIHDKVLSLPRLRTISVVILIASLIYGPALYFGWGISSFWFAENYHTRHDRVAPAIFARIAAGQRVTIAGNTAHMKSFQFYALATPQGRYAFHLLNRHTEQPFPEEIIDKTDVLFYVYPGCEGFSLLGFLPATIMRSQYGVDACVFDRPGVSQQLQEARVDLPSTTTLLPEFIYGAPPIEPHTPFHGPIYGI